MYSHYHTDILNIINALGYEENEIGVCQGITYMGIQAFLAGDKEIKEFNDRLKLLDSIKLALPRDFDKAYDKREIIKMYKEYFDSTYKALRKLAIDNRFTNMLDDKLVMEIDFSLKAEFNLTRKIALKTVFYRLRTLALKNSNDKLETEKKFNKINAEIINPAEKNSRVSELGLAELKEWEESGCSDEINSLINIEIEIENQYRELFEKDVDSKREFLYKKDNKYMDKFFRFSDLPYDNNARQTWSSMKNLEIFMEGVYAYYNPAVLLETGLIGKNKFVSQTLIADAIPLLQPVILDSRGTINLVTTNEKPCEECRYFADSNDLADYLESFMYGLKNYKVKERVSFCLHSGNHYVGIGVDIQKDKFVLIGPNSLPITRFDSPYQVAKFIAKEFGGGRPASPIIINFKTYKTSNDNDISNLIADAFYQKHEIEKKRYKIPYDACNQKNDFEENKCFDKSTGQSVLDMAVQCGQYALVEKILAECKEPGPQLLLNRYKNDSPLHFSILFELPEITTLLLKHQADPNAQGKNEQTPLHLAVMTQSPEMTKLLLDNKADPDIRDANNLTALHYAVSKQNPMLIKILLAYGVDPGIRDIRNNTALMYAKTPEVISLLEAAEECKIIPTFSTNKHLLFTNKNISPSDDEDNNQDNTKKNRK